MQCFKDFKDIYSEGRMIMGIVRSEADLIKVVEHYSDTIYKTALSYTKCKATAEDILQETLMKYMLCETHFENENHLKAWLIRVTINECKKFYRLFWNSKRIPLEDIYSFETPERHEIFFAVMALPVKYRMIIHLFYYEGFSVKEISKLLNKNENTVLSLLHRARKMLRSEMEVEYEYKRV